MKPVRSAQELTQLKANASKVVDMANSCLSFCQQESCGKCVPCRIGAKRMSEIMERIHNGQGKKGDIETLEKLGNYMRITSFCGLGQSAANTVLTTISCFRDEFEFYLDPQPNVD